MWQRLRDQRRARGPRPDGVAANPTRTRGPAIPLARLRFPTPRGRSLGLIPYREITGAFATLNEGNQGDRFEVDYNDLPDGMASLIPLLPLEGRYVIELANGHTFPLNDWNRVSMAHFADRAFLSGRADLFSSNAELIETGLTTDTVFTIRMASLDRRARYGHVPDGVINTLAEEEARGDRQRELERERRRFANPADEARVNAILVRRARRDDFFTRRNAQYSYNSRFNTRNRPFGSFFPYYHQLPGVYWQRYGILAEDRLDKVPCLYRALEAAGLQEKKLNKLKSMMVTKRVPRRKLPEIAWALHIQIRLTECVLQGGAAGGERCKWYPAGNQRSKQPAEARSWPVYKIGIALDHYFVDDFKTGVTRYALRSLLSSKPFSPERWSPDLVPRGRRKGSGVPTRSTEIFRAVSEEIKANCPNGFLRKVTINRDTMDHIFFDSIGKTYNSLTAHDNDILPYGQKPEKKKKNVKKKGKEDKKEVDDDDDDIENRLNQESDDDNRKLYLTFSADFETTTNGTLHRPYLVCFQRIPYSDLEEEEEKDTTLSDLPAIRTCYGEDCGYQMLYYLYAHEYDKERHKGIRIIFHNATYDTRFLFNYLVGGKPPQVMENAGRLKSMTGYFKPSRDLPACTVIVSDSYAFIPEKLSKFPKMFNLPNVEKELIPYDLFTEENIFHHYRDEHGRRVYNYKQLHGIVPFDLFLLALEDQEKSRAYELRYAILHQKQGLTNRFLEQLCRESKAAAEKNVRLWKCFGETAFNCNGRSPVRYINMIRYAKKYCEKDVEILTRGWMKFRKLTYMALGGLDIDDTKKKSCRPYVSITQVAHDHLRKQKCFEGCYWMTGVQRDFLQNCVSGGKCMLANNQKQELKDGKIQDFDACSLYPSAIAHMGGFLKGKPKIIPKGMREVDMDRWDGFFIRIRVLGFGGMRRRFPILSYRTSSGGRKYSDGDDIIGKEIYVTKIELEDALYFYQGGFRYELLQGLYFDEGRNDLVSDVMKELYQRRRKYKAQKNPVQQVLKLVMNSCYGRTILKPIDTQTYFLQNPDRYAQTQPEKQAKLLQSNENFLDQHFYRIRQFYRMPEESGYAWRMDCVADILEHFNAPHIGAEILAYSKRIMNQVMCLAEDLDPPILIAYQDTDSMHIPDKDIPRLADAFREVYGYELIGKNMLQFHSDFSFGNLSSGTNPKLSKQIDEKNLVSTYFVGVGKKAYLDLLEVSLLQEGKKKKGDKEEQNKRKREKEEEAAKRIVMKSPHFRLKGVSSAAIYEYCIENKITLFDLFTSLRDGKRHCFDLITGGKKRFKINKNYTVNTLDRFIRRVEFPGNVISCSLQNHSQHNHSSKRPRKSSSS